MAESRFAIDMCESASPVSSGCLVLRSGKAERRGYLRITCGGQMLETFGGGMVDSFGGGMVKSFGDVMVESFGGDA